MNKFLILSRVLIKNNYGKMFSGKKAIIRNLALVLCMVPFMIMMYFQMDSFFGLGMVRAGVEFGLLGMCMATVMTVFFSFPAILYFSDDTPQLMALPIPAWCIVWAKTVMIFLSCALLNLIILLPMLVSGLTSTAVDFLGILFLIIGAFTLIVSVLFILGSLFILLMKLMPGKLNKNSFAVISMTAAIVLSIVLSISISSNSSQSDSMAFFNPEELTLPTGPIFQIPLLGQAVINHNWISFILVLASTVLFGFVYQILSEKFYLKSAAACASSVSGKRKSKGNSESRRQPVFRVLCMNEIRELLRIPAYLMNNVLGSVIGPIIITLMFFFVPSLREAAELLAGFDLSQMSPGSIGFLGGAAATLFMGSTNMVSGTAVSRRGINGVKFMKSIPVAVSTQLFASELIGFALTAFGSLLFLIPVKLLISTPLIFDLTFLAGVLLLSWMVNSFELLLDIRHPKLVWDNETALMKNNYNSIICMLGLWAFLGLLAFVIIFGFDGNLFAGAILTGISCLALSILFTWLTPKTCQKYLKNLS